MPPVASKTLVSAILAVAALAALLYVFGGRESSRLTIKDRAFPPGFRELVLHGGSTRFDPILGLQAPAETSERKPAVREACDALYRDLSSPVAGGGRIPVVAFLDYRCPYCKTLTAMLSDLPRERDVRVIYKEWPVLGDASVLAARAALAADRQGQYLAFHARIMGSRLVPTPAYLEDVAAELGMDRTRLRADMNAPGTTEAIRRTATLAAQLGLPGTPVLVVGRTFAAGAITRAQLERLIAIEAENPPADC